MRPGGQADRPTDRQTERQNDRTTGRPARASPMGTRCRTHVEPKSAPSLPSAPRTVPTVPELRRPEGVVGPAKTKDPQHLAPWAARCSAGTGSPCSTSSGRRSGKGIPEGADARYVAALRLAEKRGCRVGGLAGVCDEGASRRHHRARLRSESLSSASPQLAQSLECTHVS